MDERHIIYPDQQNYEKAFQLAFSIAREKLAAITDIEEQCRKAGARYEQVDGRITAVVAYLNQFYRIHIPDGEISPGDDSDPLNKRDGLIILHYFLTANGKPPAGKLITFRELPDGSIYQPTFAKRTIQPLVNNFGREAHSLLLYSQRMGGYKADYGDTAITINAFSKVPVTFVVWQGDDEFASQGNVLFDAGINDYLPTEDITVLCEIIAWRLVKSMTTGTL